MKSIVLCERTLVQDNEDFSNLKEEKRNEEGNEKEEEEKILNGDGGDVESETDTGNFGKDRIPFQNGDKSSSEEASIPKKSLEVEVPKKGGSKDGARANHLTSEVDGSVASERNGLCSDRDESDCNSRENLSSESIILESIDEHNSSMEVQSRSFQSEVDCSVEHSETDDDAIQILEAEESGNSSQQSGNESSKKSCNPSEENELKVTESKENVHPLEDITLDLDENKENEKEEKTNALGDFSGDDLLNKDSGECEIQVGEVQTISGSEKDAMWADNDLKKCDQDLKIKLEEKLLEECQDISTPTEESMSVVGDEKEDDCQEIPGDENEVFETHENIEEGMHIEVEESEHAEELKIEEKESEVTDSESVFSNKNCGRTGEEVKMESAVRRKRHMSENHEDDPLGKKKRIAGDGAEADLVQSEEEDSSRCESLASLETTVVSSKADQTSSVTKAPKAKRGSTEEKDSKKLKPSDAKEGEEIKKHQRTEAMLSVLENFRGTLKTLTRSDLEELIVQKLCEVITERSNVGELRRKAQALEQDQERWKAKAQSLTKQMREMEMVMKKYITEVQKQIKEGDTHVVTPLKVTRSVGLQVSFYSSANKGLKANFPQAAPSTQTQNVNARNVKGSPTKMPLQYSPVTQNMRNKPAPSFQKVSPLRKSPISQQRRSTVPTTDYGSAPANRQVVQQSLLNSNRGPQSQPQVQRPNYKQIASQQSYNQQQQQQNGSKVIDLTEDDDRQTGNTGKTSKSLRVVNNLTQSATSQNNRFTYLLPTTSSSTASSVGQSRQVLIATPSVPQSNRQIMCSMPPLLFKGGNVVQSGSQTQLLNQLNKVILPKPARHPAPLPQPPVFKKSTRPCLKLLPPRPALKVSKVQTGIVLSWNMALSPEHAPIVSYQLYAYQESDSPPATTLWKKVGDVKALPLPMACTLTQFMSGHKYHFAVRAVDLHSRIGPFSFPGTIVLV